jgi:hypothetical protein
MRPGHTGVANLLDTLLSVFLPVAIQIELIFPQDIGHRVKNPIMIRNEVEDETITQASQSGI